MKKIIYTFVAVIMLVMTLLNTSKVVIASTNGATIDAFRDMTSTSYILMEANTGKVLINFNENEKLPVASICKLMTSLITLEEIEKGNLTLEDKILVSQHAAMVEGSQAFLDAGCEYTVRDLLKSVIVASANDSAIALAEGISGSEAAFVTRMNDRAKELGMSNTNYTNATGLTTKDQYSTAYDTCLVLKAINRFEVYQEFAKIWMDTLVHPSGRETELVNTNRLIKYYPYCIDGKTGFTDEAGYCLSSVSQKDNLKLIAVTLNCKDAASRFRESMMLYDYGFANFENKVVLREEDYLENIQTNHAKTDFVNIGITKDLCYLHDKTSEEDIEVVYNLPQMISAPMKKGEVVGSIAIMQGADIVDRVDVILLEDIEKQDFSDILEKIANKWNF
ncbi:MAG: D-alanyl-D-alanine carboxypeptidase [Clostridia bacterium]|nr:D-alanyl-D-alanine carboxypeptidase [Clostridia bacterium]